MKTSKTGVELIKRFEGKFLTAYHGAADRPGLLTIGYGHTDAAGPPKVTKGMKISDQEATDILVADLKSVEISVNRLVKVPLKQNEFDALVSFTFNLGEGNLAKSTLLKRLNSGDYKIADEFKKWNKANGKVVQGLINRRNAEAALWNNKTPTITPDVGGAVVVIAGTGTAASQAPTDWVPYIIVGGVILSFLTFTAFNIYARIKDIKNVQKALDKN